MVKKPEITVSDIKGQAEEIRDILQRLIDTCDSEQGLDRYARNKITGGSLSGDVAALGVMIIAYEYGHDL